MHIRVRSSVGRNDVIYVLFKYTCSAQLFVRMLFSTPMYTMIVFMDRHIHPIDRFNSITFRTFSIKCTFDSIIRNAMFIHITIILIAMAIFIKFMYTLLVVSV
jgi:hypothetical protein